MDDRSLCLFAHNLPAETNEGHIAAIFSTVLPRPVVVIKRRAPAGEAIAYPIYVTFATAEQCSDAWTEYNYTSQTVCTATVACLHLRSRYIKDAQRNILGVYRVTVPKTGLRLRDVFTELQRVWWTAKCSTFYGNVLSADIPPDGIVTGRLVFTVFDNTQLPSQPPASALFRVEWSPNSMTQKRVFGGTSARRVPLFIGNIPHTTTPVALFVGHDVEIGRVGNTATPSTGVYSLVVRVLYDHVALVASMLAARITPGYGGLQVSVAERSAVHFDELRLPTDGHPDPSKSVMVSVNRKVPVHAIRSRIAQLYPAAVLVSIIRKKPYLFIQFATAKDAIAAVRKDHSRLAAHIEFQWKRAHIFLSLAEATPHTGQRVLPHHRTSDTTDAHIAEHIKGIEHRLDALCRRLNKHTAPLPTHNPVLRFDQKADYYHTKIATLVRDRIPPPTIQAFVRLLLSRTEEDIEKLVTTDALMQAEIDLFVKG